MIDCCGLRAYILRFRIHRRSEIFLRHTLSIAFRLILSRLRQSFTDSETGLHQRSEDKLDRGRGRSAQTYDPSTFSGGFGASSLSSLAIR